MGKLNQEQESILAQIDAIMTMIERSKSSFDMFDNLGASVSLSPIKLLLTLLKRFGVGYDEIVDWLAKYIVYVTPILELSVKGILLANLKSNIDCNLDPRIPQYLRERVGGVSTIDLNNETNTGDASGMSRGIEIDLSTIDYYGMLNESPMSPLSHFKYFGTNKYYEINGEKFYTNEEVIKYCEKNDISINDVKYHSEIDSVYELARARDLNAFLWFVIHKARFLNVTQYAGDGSILQSITNTDNGEIALGEVFSQANSNVLGLCIKHQALYTTNGDIREQATPNSGKEITNDDIARAQEERKQSINEYQHMIVPVSNIWNGCNWYVDRSRYFDFVRGTDSKTERQYGNEFALFRLNMMDIDGRNTNKLVFTIKPSPNIITPKIDANPQITKNEKGYNLELNIKGDSPWNFRRVLFNSKGEKDAWGKYSVIIGAEDKDYDDKAYRKYKVMQPNNPSVADEDIALMVNRKTREYFLSGKTETTSVLYECYPGLTVYEFNYDYVMGMQLFDPTVIVAQLVEALVNIQIGISANIKKNSDYKARISEITKKLMTENRFASSDCFYTFSNAEYDAMQEKSELQRANLYPFQGYSNNAKQMPTSEELCSVLNEMNSDTSIEGSVDVITRAINNVSANITEESGLDSDKYSVEFDFISKAVEMIVASFVEAMLTPKMLLVFLVNKKLMGEASGKWDVEYLLNAFFNIIVAMVNEAIDMLVKKLLDFVMEKIKELLEAAAKLLLWEYVEFYTRLLSQMIKACSFRLPNNPNLASTLDNVNYADIEPLSEDSMPISEC